MIGAPNLCKQQKLLVQATESRNSCAAVTTSKGVGRARCYDDSHSIGGKTSKRIAKIASERPHDNWCYMTIPHHQVVNIA